MHGAIAENLSHLNDKPIAQDSSLHSDKPCSVDTAKLSYLIIFYENLKKKQLELESQILLDGALATKTSPVSSYWSDLAVIYWKSTALPLLTQ